MLLEVWLQRERRHHRHNMQKENCVRAPQVWDFAALHFEVSPKELIRRPGKKAKTHQHPKESGTTLISDDIGNARGGGREKQDQLQNVTESHKAKAAWQEQ